MANKIRKDVNHVFIKLYSAHSWCCDMDWLIFGTGYLLKTLANQEKSLSDFSPVIKKIQ